jgi:DnaJ-class molecular chaperone
MLEQKGYAFVPVTADVDDPLFFTMPYRERVVQYGGLLPTCFDLLGLAFPCSVAEVKAAYRDLAKRAHPDRGGSHGEFLELQAAYEQALHLCRYAS